MKTWNDDPIDFEALRAWGRKMLLPVVVVVVIAALGINAARVSSCSANRHDRFESAFITSSSLSVLPNTPAMLF